MRLSYGLLGFMIFNLVACEKMALLTTPPKKQQLSNSPLATRAERYFWRTLHEGRYQDIPQADYLLMAAYLENPYDSKLAAHLGFIHIWKITERERVKNNSPLLPNEIILSKKYFADALQLDPENPIYQGFYGDTQLVEGQIFKDKQEEVRGYFTLQKAISNWPEFNYFTAGYPMSSLSADSDHFKKGLDWQWKTLDICAGEKISRQNPDFTPYMKRETTIGAQRACWNSEIAPHNFEGFFMNMGDMLVKSGDPETGIKIYNNAKLAKNYNKWPYKDMLEKRVLNAKANVQHFNQKSNNPNQSIMFNSGYGCVVCHQR
ncbi:hypothetical protein SDA22_13365 [Legionella pneumophila serogroup 1]|uniref:hypothetical protein n=1 Tax=Legionella pneumophila TaxID=446 RepID=UPI0007706EF9|nr:hypothetical protein [Legionella pneumophila]HAT8918916.1 hypothetical protein [Legionella pneumophila subsp. pneumophila]AMV13009.1 hypothetical protein ULM_03070 [Legionella pneumophila]MCZ4703415.1 hypothetical protein [Legionella pneumophila]MDI9844227.1 hypothetical protein [Legionella pneumophila]CZG60593.1 Uncharacterised protein [Legionella pneumophila]